MHVLLTGGCGYIGTLLTARLLKEEHKVTVVDIMWFGNYLPKNKNLTVIKQDIRNISNIPMDGVDTVIHLANIANDPCGELNSKLVWEVNVLATMQLVEKAIQNKVKQFIYASSGSVYGVKEEAEVTEDLSLVPISDYNKTKMISERVLLSYKDLINIICIRPATVCGYSPRMRLDLSVNMLTSQALIGKRITVFGGNQTRPNIHIKDMFGVYMHFLKKGNELKGIYNAGFENISIMDIAEKVVKNVPAEIVVTESNDPRSYHLSSNKLIATGFSPEYSVLDGIRDVIEAYGNGKIKDEENCYNIKTMKKLKNLC
ncbi:MAG: SDR family oxidoreductase [Actinobacteria bacterium]|nr:SDR family oxidoreductase [Chloroflexota bacterium]MBE3128748.1 SDR family oxidoreductase [Actinomycetota bacterium]